MDRSRNRRSRYNTPSRQSRSTLFPERHGVHALAPQPAPPRYSATRPRRSARWRHHHPLPRHPCRSRHQLGRRVPRPGIVGRGGQGGGLLRPPCGGRRIRPPDRAEGLLTRIVPHHDRLRGGHRQRRGRGRAGGRRADADTGRGPQLLCLRRCAGDATGVGGRARPAAGSFPETLRQTHNGSTRTTCGSSKT